MLEQCPNCKLKFVIKSHNLNNHCPKCWVELKPLKKVLGTNAKIIAERSKGLYRLTPKDVENIEVALRLRVESCDDNGDDKEAAMWKRTWRKFF